MLSEWQVPDHLCEHGLLLYHHLPQQQRSHLSSEDTLLTGVLQHPVLSQA